MAKGKKIFLAKRKKISLAEGKKIFLAEGKKISLAEGKKIFLANGKKISPAEGKKISWSEGKDNSLAEGKIAGHLARLAAPAIIAQLINALYNVIDRIFIGHLPDVGAMAITGIGITFPITVTISAFSSLLGKGGAPLAAISLGAGNKERSEKILGNCTSTLVLISFLLTLFLLITKEPILYAFGAGEETFAYANDFISVYVLGTVFVQLALGLNPFISTQGYAKTAMMSILIGAVINTVLDPVFIFVFHWGVKGAAFATVIAQGVSAGWIIYFLCSQKSNVRIRRQYLKPDLKIIQDIVKLGISPFIIESSTSLINVVLNTQFRKYGGDMYIGAVTIMTSIMVILNIPIIGITQGAQPIISYNFGAGNYKRVMDTYRLAIKCTFVFGLISFLFVLYKAQLITGIFSNNRELSELTALKMPLYFGGLWAIALHITCQTTFLAIGQAKFSIFLVLFRKLIVMIPLAYILPLFWGVDGVFWATAIADISASCMTFTVFQLTIRKILKVGNRGQVFAKLIK